MLSPGIPGSDKPVATRPIFDQCCGSRAVGPQKRDDLVVAQYAYFRPALIVPAERNYFHLLYFASLNRPLYHRAGWKDEGRPVSGRPCRLYLRDLGDFLDLASPDATQSATFTRFEPPFTTARTLCRLRFQRRFVTLWAWLMRLPNCGPRARTIHNSSP